MTLIIFLRIDDKLVSINGVNVENVEHAFVLRLLKEAKDFIHLEVKRRTNNAFSREMVQSSETAKRRNLAMHQTAASVISNYSSLTQEANSPMQLMLTNSSSVSSLKPIKVTLSKKEKRESFGLVIGCKFYIKDILPNSLAAQEANLQKGDVLLRLNDITSDQMSLTDLNKIIGKSKESRLNLLVKRDSLGSSEEDLVDSSLTSVCAPEPPVSIKRTPIKPTSSQIGDRKDSATTTCVESLPDQSLADSSPFKSTIAQNENMNNRMSRFYSK